MIEQKVVTLLEKAFEEHPELFLIELKTDDQNNIKITIDGDKGVSVADCVAVSRIVEHNLDRETEDFSLEVSSAGAFSPLVQKRQYHKNIGRVLELETISGEKKEGTLEKVTPDTIEITWTERVPKEKRKGKVNVVKTETIPFENIKNSNVKIIF